MGGTQPSELDDWDFALPPERIAVRPVEPRDHARLMVLGREEGRSQRRFDDLVELLQPGDLLVANDTRVMAARLAACRATGGAVELLLLEPGPGPVQALARPARRLKQGEILHLEGGASARLVEPARDGIVRVELDRAPAQVMAEQGHMPLPPYLGRGSDRADQGDYQTVYAGPLGAAAAPTAGLHFTPGLIDRLRGGGVDWATVTLHVGLGTFRPLRPEDLDRGELHREVYTVPEDTVEAIRRARRRSGRVIAVGTTTTRALESACPTGQTVPRAGSGATTLFVRPPYEFSVIDGLLTNFHLPRSSLLMLVAALCGRARLLAAYEDALRNGYRFYSYGDAMLIV